MEIQRISKDICNVISSGSKGNCEIYGKHIAVDMGIPFKAIKPYLNQLQLVLISHKHQDHFNLSTIKKLAFERPTLRFGVGEWMVPLMDGIKNIDVYELNRWYDYGHFKICIGKLYHDTPNCFYRIFIKQPNGEYFKIFRATDTSHLIGIEAKDYDAYCIEHNYDENTIFDSIAKKKALGQFAHQEGAINSHLSEQQARDFIFKNRGEHSQVLRLHESSSV